MGQAEEAYERYAIPANQSTSYLATYRAIVRKHPEKVPAEILCDLIQSTPGEEGKWFATAKEAGLLDLAIELANRSPTDPQTLTRAARDFMDRNPVLALEAGLAALRWFVQGYGYEVTRADVWTTYSHTMQVAERLGRRDEIRARVGQLAARVSFSASRSAVGADVMGGFVDKIIRSKTDNGEDGQAQSPQRRKRSLLIPTWDQRPRAPRSHRQLGSRSQSVPFQFPRFENRLL
jgi:hypothetical protein